jgi:hypothetical protein
MLLLITYPKYTRFEQAVYWIFQDCRQQTMLHVGDVLIEEYEVDLLLSCDEEQ